MRRIALSFFIFLICSCEGMMEREDEGKLRIEFSKSIAEETKAQIPDTDDFILEVVEASGTKAFKGRFGNSPDVLELSPGTYTVTAKSCEFSEPLFESPQYGDSQSVKIKAGEIAVVQLGCVQMNCGIKIVPDYSFLSEFPDGELFLNSAQGTLMYSYSEKRYAFFNPGTIRLELKSEGQTSTLLTRNLTSQQMLQINLSAAGKPVSGKSGTGISIQIDTTRNWLVENYTIGGEGNEKENALSVSEAKSHTGENGVWICGYIVGGDLSSSKCSFTPPFTSNTNIVLAERANCRDREYCFSVQLAKGDIRDALNLVDNPENLGRKVYLKGNIVDKYYGIPGIQSVSEYALE